MKARYRLIRRGIRGGAFYCVDSTTCKRTSLGTTNPDEAQQIIEAKNQAERQPVLNLQIAKAYLAFWHGQRPDHPHLAAGDGDADGVQAGSQ